MKKVNSILLYALCSALVSSGLVAIYLAIDNIRRKPWNKHLEALYQGKNVDSSSLVAAWAMSGLSTVAGLLLIGLGVGIGYFKIKGKGLKIDRL